LNDAQKEKGNPSLICDANSSVIRDRTHESKKRGVTIEEDGRSG